MSAVPTNVQPLPSNLDDLVANLIQAKKAEDQAKKARVALEDRILALVPAREEGSETTALASGTKLTTTGVLAYSVDDIDALRAVTKDWEANLIPLKTKTELDDAGCKYLRRERPDLWLQLAKVVTVKPRKTAIKVGI